MLCALAAQVSLTEIPIVIRVANQVHNIDCVRHGTVSNVKVDPAWHRTLLGKAHPSSFFEVGKMANAGKIGASRNGEHRIGYNTRTKARECSTSPGTDMRKYGNWFISQIRTRTSNKKCTIENKLGETISETNRDRNHVWR